MAQTGVWVVVDEDGRGEAVRKAVSSQAQLVAVSDPFSARRTLAREEVAGLIVVVGRRTLSLQALCGHVRRELPRLPVIAVRNPRVPDDPGLVAVVTDIIDDGLAQDVADRLAGVSDAFVAGEITAVVPPPRPAQAPPSPPPPLAMSAPQPTTAPTTPAPAPTAPAAPRVAALPRTASRAAPWAAVVELMATAPPPPPPIRSATAAVPADVETAEPTVTNVSPEAVTETHVGVSVGSTSDSEEDRERIKGAGAELLVRLAADHRTGRLLVSEGEGAGTIHVAHGTPVGAELATGDGGLYRRLLSSGLLQPGLAPPIVRQGQLLRALVNGGALSEPQRLAFERSVLRDAVLAIARQPAVAAVFVATRQAQATPAAPPLNVFGLVLEARRKTIAPEVIAAMGDELAPWRLNATTLLQRATGLVAPFCPGQDVVAMLVDASVESLMLRLGWDRASVTLFLLALRDAGLIEVREERSPSRPPRPLGHSPRQLLGVPLDADEDEIDDAYAAHVARIDADLARASSASEREALRALRERYDVARQALRLQLGFITGASTNPF